MWTGPMPAPEPLRSSRGPPTTMSCPAAASRVAGTAMPGARTPSSLVTRTRTLPKLPLTRRQPDGDDPGHDGQDQDDHDQRENGSPRPGRGSGVGLLRAGEDLERQRGVGPVERVVGEAVDGTYCEQQRRRL